MVAVVQPVAARQTGVVPFYFVVSLRHSPFEMYKGYQPLVNYLRDSTGFPFELKLTMSDSDTVQFLQSHPDSIGYLRNLSYVRFRRALPLVPVLKPLNNDGKPQFWPVLIVPQRSAIRSLRQLRGARIAFGSVDSAAASALPRMLLFQEDLFASRDFEAMEFPVESDVVKAVLQHQADAGFVSNVMALELGGAKVRTITMRETVPTHPVVVSAKCRKDLVREVTTALLRLDPRRNPHYRAITEKIDSSIRYGFVPAAPADYNSLDRLLFVMNNAMGSTFHEKPAVSGKSEGENRAVRLDSPRAAHRRMGTGGHNQVSRGGLRPYGT